jgi:hypothetical protein
MSTNFLKKFNDVEIRRQKLIADLIRIKKMVKGSFCQIHVKCGKKNCRCSTGTKHSHWRMSIKENGKSFSRAVPPDEYEWIKEMTENYRKFKDLRNQLLDMEIETKTILDSFEIEMTKQAKKGKAYLAVGDEVSEVKSKKTSGASKNEGQVA